MGLARRPDGTPIHRPLVDTGGGMVIDGPSTDSSTRPRL